MNREEIISKLNDKELEKFFELFQLLKKSLNDGMRELQFMIAVAFLEMLRLEKIHGSGHSQF